MFRNLYGEFIIRKRSDYGINLLKILYMIFTLPFVMFAIFFSVYTLTFNERSFEGDISLIDRLFIHFSAILVSIVIYVIVLNAALGFI